MRKVGIYYAYWEENWAADFLPYIRKAQQLGYEQLEIQAGHVAAIGKAAQQRLRKEAEDRGMVLSYSIGLAAEKDPSSLDEATRLRGIAAMREIIAAVGTMGGGLIVGVVHSSWPGQLPLGCIDKRPYWDQSRKSMVELGKIAQDQGVVLAVESLNRFEHFLINTSSEARSFVEAVASPAVGILLDTFHMNIEEESFEEAIRCAGSYLKSLHLGEPNRKPLAANTRLPLAAIKKTLDQIGYQGPMVNEPFVRMGGEVGYNIRVNRNLISPEAMDRAAEESAAFIKASLR